MSDLGRGPEPKAGARDAGTSPGSGGTRDTGAAPTAASGSGATASSPGGVVEYPAPVPGVAREPCVIERTVRTRELEKCAAAVEATKGRLVTIPRRDAADLALHPIRWRHVAAALRIKDVHVSDFKLAFAAARPHEIVLAARGGQRVRIHVAAEFERGGSAGTAASPPPDSAGPTAVSAPLVPARDRDLTRRLIDDLAAVVPRKDELEKGRRKRDVIVVTGTRDFRGQPERQGLRHLSRQFFSFVMDQAAHEGKVLGEQEVQSAVVNDRVVIGTNLTATRELLVDWAVRKRSQWLDGEGRNWLASLLTSDVGTTRRARRGTDRLSDSLAAADSDVALTRVLRAALVDSAIHVVNVMHPADAVSKLTSPQYANTVLVCAGPDDMHAEQKIVLALALARQRQVVRIYGTKRPCAICSVTLRFAKERLGLDNLEFNEHPGLLFDPPAWTLVEYFRPLNPDGFEEWWAATRADVEAYTDVHYNAYDTPSESEEDDHRDRRGAGGSAGRKRHADDRPSPGDAKKSRTSKR